MALNVQAQLRSIQEWKAKVVASAEHEDVGCGHGAILERKVEEVAKKHPADMSSTGWEYRDSYYLKLNVSILVNRSHRTGLFDLRRERDGKTRLTMTQNHLKKGGVGTFIF